MLQHYSTEKVNRLHKEAKDARLRKQVAIPLWRITLAQVLTHAAKRVDGELQVSFERKAPA